MKALITQAMVNQMCKARQREEVWDARVMNFFVQVRSSGVATFYVRYTMPGSTEKQSLRLGDAAVLRVADARLMAQRVLGQAAQGIDPAQIKKDSKACPTLQEVVDEHYLPHIKKTKKSWDTDDTMLRCHVLPVLGKKALNVITTADIETLMQAMREGKSHTPQRGKKAGEGYAPATCNRVAVLLRYLYNLAIDTWNLQGVSKNPAKKVKLFPVNNIRQVFLTPEEIGALVEAGAPKPGQQNAQTLEIVMLLTLTGVRRANALKARWCEFDEARGLWNIPVTKSGKPQCLQLSQEVLTLLQQLKSRGRSEYLFPNPKTGKPFTSIFYSWNTMRKQAGLSHVRLHDLRHTFASLLVNGGASLYSVQKALGHSSPQITMRYAHLADHTQRQAIQSASTQLRAFLPAPAALTPQTTI